MEKYMQIAFKEALKSYKKGDVPVGAVIVKNNKIIAKSHNNRQLKTNVLGHAEINVILKAEKKLKDWRLNECDLYVLMSPCELCDYVIKKSRINKVYYLIKNDKNKNKLDKIYTQTNVCKILKDEYKKILKNFFENLRK